MKKLIILLTFLLLGISANALTLNGEAQFDWVDISQLQRNSQIDYYHQKLFEDENSAFLSKSEFQQKYAPYKKDINHKENYHYAKLDVKETSDRNICAFYYHNDILIIYAIQYKNDPRKIFYYNAYGTLQYVDEVSENYPNFPYTSRQYRANGKLVSAIYFVTNEMQYMYKPNGKFKGLWYKEKMYDKNGKQTVTRTNWGI